MPAKAGNQDRPILFPTYLKKEGRPKRAALA